MRIPGSRGSPGCSAGERGDCGGGTRRSTASCSTPTHWSAAVRSPSTRPGEAAQAGCCRETPPSHPATIARISVAAMNARGLDVVIVSYRSRELLRECLESLRANPPSDPMNLVVVENDCGVGIGALVAAADP